MWRYYLIYLFQVTIRVAIKQATGLPPSLSHFVFCQYSLWGGGGGVSAEPVVVPPLVSADTPPPAPPVSPQAPPTSPRHQPQVTFKFDHRKDFTIPLTEEFIEHCAGEWIHCLVLFDVITSYKSMNAGSMYEKVLKFSVNRITDNIYYFVFSNYSFLNDS